jgi:hypothetical protein
MVNNTVQQYLYLPGVSHLSLLLKHFIYALANFKSLLVIHLQQLLYSLFIKRLVGMFKRFYGYEWDFRFNILH